MSLRNYQLSSILLSILLISQPSHAFQLDSGIDQVQLLELYTSEGCSSCPPADEWFSSLTNNTSLWEDFVPVGFHVTYWDDIGWRDSFGNDEFTKRQYAYADMWYTDTVYTPSIVIGGQEWKSWHRSNPEFKKGPLVGNLVVDSKDLKNFDIKFMPIREIAMEPVANIAILGFNLVSNVTRGENSGKYLRHDFVVLQHFSKKMERDILGNLSSDIQIDSLPSSKQLAIVSWIHDENTLIPIQATGGFLDK